MSVHIYIPPKFTLHYNWDPLLSFINSMQIFRFLARDVINVWLWLTHTEFRPPTYGFCVTISVCGVSWILSLLLIVVCLLKLWCGFLSTVLYIQGKLKMLTIYSAANFFFPLRTDLPYFYCRSQWLNCTSSSVCTLTSIKELEMHLIAILTEIQKLKCSILGPQHKNKSSWFESITHFIF